VRILDLRGEATAGAEVEWIERLPDTADGVRRLVGVLRAGSLAAGRYQLEISVREGDSELGVGASAFEVVAGGEPAAAEAADASTDRM